MATIDGANLINSYPVLDTRGSVNYYLQNAQKQQAKRAAEQKLLQDELAKPKIDGVRDADRPEYIEKYNKWKDTYRQIVGEKNLEKKAQLKSQFDKDELELQDLISDSKNLAKGEVALSNIFLDPAKRDNFEDDAVLRFQKSKTLPRKDPNYIRDLTAFERKLDLSKIDEDLKKVDDYLKTNAKWSNPVETAGKQGNKQGVYVTQSRMVDPTVQAKEYLNQASINPSFRLFLKKQYPNLTQEEAVLQLANQRQVREEKAPTFTANDNWKEKANYNDGLIRGRYRDGITGSAGSTDASDPIVKTIYTDIKDMQGNPKKAFTVQNYVAVNPTPIGTSQLEAVYDVRDGKNVRLPASTSLEIVGVGHVPHANGGKQLRVNLVDKEGNEFWMNENQVPVKVKSDKHYQNARNKAMKALGGQPQGQKSTPYKFKDNYSEQQKKVLSAIMNKYSVGEERAKELATQETDSFTMPKGSKPTSNKTTYKGVPKGGF